MVSVIALIMSVIDGNYSAQRWLGIACRWADASVAGLMRKMYCPSNDMKLAVNLL